MSKSRTVATNRIAKKDLMRHQIELSRAFFNHLCEAPIRVRLKMAWRIVRGRRMES